VLQSGAEVSGGPGVSPLLANDQRVAAHPLIVGP